MSWFKVEYVDGNGNVSTSTTVPWDKININNDSEGEPNPESVKHAILEDTDEGLILNIKNVFPPEGKNLRKAYNIHEQTENTKYFAGDWDQVGWVDEAVEDPSKKYSIDLTKFSEFNNSKNRKYLFCEFNYSYELEEFPGLIFSTPSLKTEIIECDKFHK